MEFTIAPDRRTASISLSPPQIALLSFLMEDVCTENHVWNAFPGFLEEKVIDDTFEFTHDMRRLLRSICNQHLAYALTKQGET
jgi:hypothetical protein